VDKAGSVLALGLCSLFHSVNHRDSDFSGSDPSLTFQGKFESWLIDISRVTF
jgi:hypothetical protein